jgi:hypothetical protein
MFIFLEKIKTSPPVHRVHIECFHTETVTLFNTRGKLLTRYRGLRTLINMGSKLLARYIEVRMTLN